MLSNASLKYHYHPVSGWLNDPNGLIYFNGQYHVFYQYSPHSETPAIDVWGHAVTKDFVTWKELPVAIANDMPYDCMGVWSGTAIKNDDILYAFYASCDETHRQTISLAFSKDGEHFEKYSGNPVIREYPPDGSGDFRDPAVYEQDGRYYMLIGSAYPDGHAGNLLLYESDDLLHWSYKNVLMEYPDCKSCECPSFVKADGGCIIAVSNRPLHGPHYFEVMYGTFDGNSFVPKITSRFQKGPDEYAGQIFRDEQGRVILISWVSGWQYQFPKCIGCLSIPLELKIQNDRITAWPVQELRHLIDSEGTIQDSYVTERYINNGEEVYIQLDLTDA